MSTRLRVGIIGIGRAWPRWRSALDMLRAEIEPQAICDHVPERAERAARQLGCTTAGGPAELVNREDVDALLLLSRQWFGLWPIALAAPLGKPVYAAMSLLADEAHADALDHQVRVHQLPVQMPVPALNWPALKELREKLGQERERPLLVRADCWLKSSLAPFAGEEAFGRALLNLLHVSGSVFNQAPVQVRTAALPACSLMTVLLEYGPDRMAQLTCWQASGQRSGCRLHVDLAHACFTLDAPGRLTWKDPTGRHEQHLRPECWRVDDMTRFLHCVRDKQPIPHDLAAGHRALTCLRAARRSLAEGCAIRLDSEEPATQ